MSTLSCLCSPGTFALANGTCVSCVAGTYASAAGSTSCTLCTPGSYSNAALTACSPCAAGTYLNSLSQSCVACSPGSYSPAAGAVACTVNPPGFASSTQTTFTSSVTLAGVSSASFGAAQNATLATSIASTLAVSASAVAITAVSSAAPGGRHLLQASASVAFAVTTTNNTQASALRSALNATSAFAGALTTSLRSSADPVLSITTGIVATAPTETALVLAALPCEAGTFLNGLTQSCDPCAAGLVTTTSGASTCAKCPLRSAWVNPSSCVVCPSNSVTSPSNPAQCACDFGYYDTLFGANLTAPICDTCPLGGKCVTGFVGAAAGFWRESTRSAFFYQCREGNCVEEDVSGPLIIPPNITARRKLLQLAGNASVPSNCVEGNAGPLCALCLPGYSLQSGVCAPCDPKDAFDNWSDGSKGGLLIGCAAAGVIIIAFALFQPLSPGLELAANRIVDAASAAAAWLKEALASCVACVCRSSAAEPSASKIDEDAARDPGSGSPSQVPLASMRNAGAASLGLGGLAMAGGDDDGGGEEEDDGESGSESDGAVDVVLDFQDELEEMLEKLQKYAKIIVNFYQIVSTFLKSLDIPWPHIFGVVMARVNVVNLNLVQLPKTACLNPSPSFYKQFNGYTLGLLFAMIFMAVLYLLGVKLIAPLSLRSIPEQERVDRMAKFNSTVLSRSLLVLYLVYPGVSVAIFQMFSCTKLKSGVAYLDADFTIVCYDKVHLRYVGGAIIWLFLVPLGVPVFFIWLLRRFKVPQMAKILRDSAWVREAVKLAWQSGVAQPALDVAKLNVDSISDAHLEGLFAFFVRGASAEVAGDIANGKAPALPDVEPEAPPPPSSAVGKLMAKLKGAAKRAGGVLQRIQLAAYSLVNPDAAVHHLESPEAAQREFLLGALLAWCETSGKLALPPLQWEDIVADTQAEERTDGATETRNDSLAHIAHDDRDPAARKAAAQSAARLVLYKDVPRLSARALKEVGFLFSAYHTGTWYWEVVELMRKLALTSILSLIAPGSAGQVVVGLLLAFFALTFNMRLKPYSDGGLNFVSQVSQLNLLAFLFVALLLKVNLDGEGDNSFFSFIVGIMSIVPIALPVLIKLWLRFYGGGLEAKMITKDAAWE